MSDIIKAIKVEKNYLKLIDKGKVKDKFNFKERLELCGYTNLNKFRNDKLDYLFKNAKFNIDITSPKSVINDIQKAIQTNKNVWYNYYNDQKLVYVGKDKTYNKQYCIDNNIVVIPFLYSGGMIVTTKFDYGLVIVSNIKGLMPRLQKYLQLSLRNLGIETTLNGNDLLLNNYKIIGGARKDLTKIYTGYYFQISFQVNKVDIDNICNKKIIKIPKGINYFYPNITREMLWKELKKWLQ